MQVLNLKPLPLGRHVLPALPYSYNDLEPVIDERTLHIHHDKHHKKYVDDLNAAEIAAENMRDSKDYHAINLIEQQLAYNGSGHILHSIYWTIMTSPDSGGKPGSVTSALMENYFGGLDECKKQFITTASKVFGSGWAILGYNPYFKRLEILQAEKHENMTQWSIIPILVCDVWEHAKVNMGTRKFLFANYSCSNWLFVNFIIAKWLSSGYFYCPPYYNLLYSCQHICYFIYYNFKIERTNQIINFVDFRINFRIKSSLH